MAATIKNGSEKNIRRVSNDYASVCVCSNDFFTMIAFVENRIEPINAMINPASGTALLLDFTSIIVNPVPQKGF